MEKGTIKRLVEVKKALRKKFLSLRRGLIDHTTDGEKHFEALIKPLNRLVDNTSKDLPALPKVKNENMDGLMEFEEEENDGEDRESDTKMPSSDENESSNLSGVPQHYMDFLSSKNDQVDRTFGINYTDNKFCMGETPVEFTNGYILIGDEKYKGTKGLYELLSKKKPTAYNDKDINTYRQILEKTGVHLSTKTRRLKSGPGYKYNKVIRDLFHSQKKGSSYKYWDKPDELVDRLRLLIASTNAGNASHRNEIIEIIEELREANIIY